MRIDKGRKPRKRNILRVEAGDGFWQRGTKTRASAMVENKFFLQNPKTASFGNVIFL